MAASIFNGTAVKILKNILRFKDGSELSSTAAGYANSLTSSAQTQLDGKASTTLNNLGTTAINADLLPATDNARNLGSTTKRFQNLFADGAYTNAGSPAIGFTARTLWDSGSSQAANWESRRLLSGATVKLDWSGTDVSLNTRKLTSVSDPTSAQDAATKNYIDSNFVADTEVGAANGVASLDAGGKIPAAQLPNSVMEYLGTWAASTNTPTLTNGTGNAGDVYVASDAGTVDFGAGNITFAAGDWVIYSGSIWEKSINSNAVASVNGFTGVVVLAADDVNAANKTLSNLTSPTAINQDLILTAAKTLRLTNNVFVTARNNANSSDIDVIKLDTNDEVHMQSSNFDLRRFTSSWWGSPVAGLTKAPSAGALGVVAVATEDHASNSTDSAADIFLGTGSKPGGSSTGNTGRIWVNTGYNDGGGNSGYYYLETGYANGAGNTGSVEMYSGVADSGNTGNVVLQSGDSTSGTTGQAFLQTGASASGNSGNINITVGTAGATRGNIVASAAVADFQAAPIRMGNDSFLTGRNAGNTADVSLIKVRSDDQVQIGNLIPILTLSASNVVSPGAGNNMGSAGAPWNLYCNFMRTAIIWDGNNATLRTDNSTVTNPINLLSGNASAGASGVVNISSGSGTTSTGDTTVETGNASAGDSGDLILRTGTATGTRGSIFMLEQSAAAAGTGYIWELQNNGTGEGAWKLTNPFKVSAVAGNTNAVDRFTYLMDSTAAARTVTLPAPASSTFVIVKDHKGTSGSNNIVINPNVAETIDGAASYTINSAYGSATFVSDGTNWSVI